MDPDDEFFDLDDWDDEDVCMSEDDEGPANENEYFPNFEETIIDSDDNIFPVEAKQDKEVQTCNYLLEEYMFKSVECVGKNYSGLCLCSLCLEPWSPDSEHKVALLKCGHLFGDNCLKAWFKSNKQDGGQRCPTCDTAARKPDIRTVYNYRTVIAIDKSEEMESLRERNKEETLLANAIVEKNIQNTNLRFFEDQLLKLKARRNSLLPRLKAKKEALKARGTQNSC